MHMNTNRGWTLGARAMVAILVALVTVSVAAPQAEAKKKAPIDPATYTTAFLSSLDSFFGTLSTHADELAARMADDVDAAVARGSVKQLLKLDKRYDKLINKELRNYEKYAAKGLKQVQKVFRKITLDPAISQQIQNAVNGALAQLDTVDSELHNQLADLIDQAMTEIESQLDDNPSGNDDGTPDQGSGDL